MTEGIETEAQRELVAGFGVDQVQGYYYFKPLPEEEMPRFMRQHAPRRAERMDDKNEITV